MFHLSSAIVQLQHLESNQGVRDVPRIMLNDATQLYKSNCSQCTKLANVVVEHTLRSNMRKSGHIKVGEVSFLSDRNVHKILVAKRDNKVMDRLNLTQSKILPANSERK